MKSTDDDAIARTVVDQINHPNYDASSMANDFSILKLNEHACIDDSSTFLSLGTGSGKHQPAREHSLAVIGTGVTIEGGGPLVGRVEAMIMITTCPSLSVAIPSGFLDDPRSDEHTIKSDILATDISTKDWKPWTVIVSIIY